MRPQSARIIDYLATGKSLTPLQALHKFGCLRLSGRILDLRQQGHRIDTDMIEVGYNKRVARYTLRSGPDSVAKPAGRGPSNGKSR